MSVVGPTERPIARRLRCKAYREPRHSRLAFDISQKILQIEHAETHQRGTREPNQAGTAASTKPRRTWNTGRTWDPVVAFQQDNQFVLLVGNLFTGCSWLCCESSFDLYYL